jgi:hypothetical protein
MRALISALVVAGVVGFALPAVADEGVTAPNKPKAAGRAIDDGTVTAPNKPKTAGRAIDDGTVTAPNKPKTAGRAIDDGTVTAPNKPKAAGRAISAEKQDPAVKSKAKKHSEPGRAADESKSGTVKSGPKDQPGRAADK